MNEFDIIVIGGGPGGYTAAIRASQLGAKVALIEKYKLGGVCNNYGCIPSKTMIRLAEIQSTTKIAEEFGIIFPKSTIDTKKLFEKRTELTEKLAKGIEFLLKSNGITVFFNTAQLKSPNEVVILKENNGKESLKTKNIIIATGSRGNKLKLFETSKNAMNSEEFLLSNSLPKDVLIIGGGPEGMEFSFMLSNLGSNVTLVEMLDRLLPQEDKEISTKMEKILKENGVNVFTGTKVVEITDESKTKVKLSTGQIVEVDKVISCTGRIPNTNNLGIEELEIEKDEMGRIKVNSKMETSVKGVYAIGDVIGGRYAHEAMQNGMVAVDNIMGSNSSMDDHLIPRCIYTIPEVASVGIKEDEIKGQNVLIGRANLKSSGRAMTLGSTDGFVKVIIDPQTKKFLGIHIINERASDIIGEALLAIKYLRTDDVINTLHPHPTLVELLREAVMDAYGEAIHFISKKKNNNVDN